MAQLAGLAWSEKEMCCCVVLLPPASTFLRALYLSSVGSMRVRVGHHPRKNFAGNFETPRLAAVQFPPVCLLARWPLAGSARGGLIFYPDRRLEWGSR